MKQKVELKRVLMEVFGGCNYTCQMCPQSSPGRDSSFKRKLPANRVYEGKTIWASAAFVNKISLDLFA